MPDEIQDELQRRAERRGLSLAAYLRRLLEREAAHRDIAEALADTPALDLGLTAEEIVHAIHEGRADR